MRFFMILLIGLTACKLRYSEDPSTVRVTKTSEQKKFGTYEVKGKEIFDGSKKILLKGVNWYGFDSKILGPSKNYTNVELQWSKDVPFVLNLLANVGFNAIRLPVSPEVLSEQTTAKNLDQFLKTSKSFGFYVLIDLHNCGWESGHLDARPCAEAVQYNQKLAKLSVNHPNVIGLDPFNEPYDMAWDEWSDFLEEATKAIHKENPNLLIFAEGIGNKGLATCRSYPPPEDQKGCVQPVFFGENFIPMRDKPFAIDRKKLVLSPHVYGPSVYPDQPYFQKPTKGGRWESSHMPEIFDDHFGYLSDDYPLAIGEFGGFYNKLPTYKQGDQDWERRLGPDKKWQDEFVQYLLDRDIEHFFYFAVNPSSGDTGGLLDDQWERLDQDKIRLLKPLLNR